MPARIILLVVACLVSILTGAQPAENPDLPDVLPTSADSNTAPPVLDDKCSGRSGEWISVDPITRRRTRLYDECQVGKFVGIITALRDRKSLGKQDEALLVQIEEATKLLEESNRYAEELDAELAAIRSSKQTLLAAIDNRSASMREVGTHNMIVKGASDNCTGYMTRIESMFGELLELEENLDFVKADARDALIAASTEIIMELEITRAELSARWGELQGLHVYEKP